jgi:O-antigen ligase
MRHWKCFLGTFLAGVLFQNLVQLSEVFSWIFSGTDWLTGSTLGNLSGFEKHPGKAALFMGFASLSWLGVIVGKCRYRKIAGCCFLFATTGMFATVSMAVSVGFVAGILCASLLTTSRKKMSSLNATHVILSGLLVVSLAWFAEGDRVISKTESVIQGVHGFIDGEVDATNSTQLRLHWWSKTLEQTVYDSGPLYGIVGHGFGSIESIDFSTEGSKVSSKAEHVHNSFIQILYENGIIGFVLFLLLLWKTISTSKCSKLLVGGWFYPLCTAGVVLWSVATFFENHQSSGRTFIIGGVNYVQSRYSSEG